MKLSILFLLSIATIYNANAESEPPGYYKIISDVYSESVSPGVCVLQGLAINQDTKDGIPGGIVGETNRIRYTTTNENGKFKVNLNAKDSSFYFYHQDFEEIVCWNYNFKSRHIVTVKFIAARREYIDVIQAEKPVIYLYSEDVIEAEISLTPRGNLTFSYPKYDNGWSVNISPEGLSVSDTKYPYLFWEGNCDDIHFNAIAGESLGYFIDTDSTIQFLESTLTAMGLNSTEMTDFITYWGPRLTAHSYASVQFLIDRDYESQIAALNVTPEPDSKLRIYMIFQGTEQVRSQRNFKAPELKKFDRKGFTLIEWGGSEIKPVQNSAILNQANY